jgi:hypothetical protein
LKKQKSTSNDDILSTNNFKPIWFTAHARQRMATYQITEEEVTVCVRAPVKVLNGYNGRKIAHRIRNSYVVRVIYEENGLITIVTVYLARKDRYER